jgi:hypothetical protein
MKRIFAGIMLVAAVVCLALPAVQAQEEAWLELLRADLRTEKTGIVTAAMMLSDDEGKIFWPIYREYDLAVASINDQRIELIKDYAVAYDTLTNEGASDIATRWFKMQDDKLKLRKSYFKKIEKALSTGVAARFIQVDHQLGLFVDLEIAADMPLIEVVE